MKKKCFSALETFKEGTHVEKTLFQIFIGVLKGIERSTNVKKKHQTDVQKNTQPCGVVCRWGYVQDFRGCVQDLNPSSPPPDNPPPPDPPPLGGRRGFTRKPENSKRAHFRAGSSKTPPKFNKKTRKKEGNLGGRAEWGLGGRSHPRTYQFLPSPSSRGPIFSFSFFFFGILPLSPSPPHSHPHLSWSHGGRVSGGGSGRVRSSRGRFCGCPVEDGVLGRGVVGRRGSGRGKRKKVLKKKKKKPNPNPLWFEGRERG